MIILKIDPKNPDGRIVKIAADILKSGGSIVYPTDTAYGLGGNALDEKTIRKVYEAKGRDFSKPTHVVVRYWQMIEKLTHTNERAKKLYDKFLPGPLTLVLPKRRIVPNILPANLPTLGVRIPDSLITQSLSNLLPFPYTTPSAIRSGGKTPYSIKEVKKELNFEKVDLILDAGALPINPPSTIINPSSFSLKILREGPITKEQIEKALNI